MLVKNYMFYASEPPLGTFEERKIEISSSMNI